MKPKWKRAESRIAASPPRHVDMDAVGRLDIGESRDDDAPDALDGVERQKTPMALDKRAHHRGFPRRAKRRAAALPRLDLDQTVDDAGPAPSAARASLRINSVDLDAQIGESRFRWLGHETPSPFEGLMEIRLSESCSKRLRCSSTRRSRRCSSSHATCRAGIRSRRPCPSD